MTVIALNFAASTKARKPAGFSCAVYNVNALFAYKQRSNLKQRAYFTHQLRTHTTSYCEYSKQNHSNFLDIYTFLSANEGEFTVTHQYTRDEDGEVLCSTWYAEVDGTEWDFATQADLADFLDESRWR